MYRRPDEVGDQCLGDLSTCAQLPAVSNTAYASATSIFHCREPNPTTSQVVSGPRTFRGLLDQRRSLLCVVLRLETDDCCKLFPNNLRDKEIAGRTTTLRGILLRWIPARPYTCVVTPTAALDSKRGAARRRRAGGNRTDQHPFATETVLGSINPAATAGPPCDRTKPLAAAMPSRLHASPTQYSFCCRLF